MKAAIRVRAELPNQKDKGSQRPQEEVVDQYARGFKTIDCEETLATAFLRDASRTKPSAKLQTLF